MTDTVALSFRMTREQRAKLERLKKQSRRPSIQNVLEALVAMADEADPRWHVSPTIAARKTTKERPHA